jgi:hypothetical protein
MSKAEKMRGRLASMQKDREEFERQKRDLEAHMTHGVQHLEKIQKGLKHNEVVNEIIPPENHLPKKDPVIKNNGKKDSVSGPSSSQQPTTSESTHLLSLMPSGPRISDWCYNGPIDSSPPMMKSRDLYENVRALGRGSFGEVNLVKNVEDNKL